MGGTAYLLTTGPRDDRRVIAVYSTREAAVAALRFGDGKTVVEEFPLDAPFPPAPAHCSLWHVMEDDPSSAFQLVAFDLDEPIDEVTVQADTAVVCVWARDEAHAIQLGFEKIHAFRARTASG